MPFRFVRIKPGPDWLCFARSAPFAVTHGAPPPSAVIPAEGGWATWPALTGTPQTDPAASVGFVSQHWHGEQNHFPVMDLEPVRTRELALFRKSGEAPACRSNPQSTIRSPKPSAAPVGFVSHGRRLLRFVQARLVGTPGDAKCCVSTQMPSHAHYQWVWWDQLALFRKMPRAVASGVQTPCRRKGVVA